MRDFSIYLHIPFCRRLCPYCHFYRVPEVPPWERFLEALRREIDTLDTADLGRVDTIYAGGGTPTLLPPEFFAGFFRTVGERFDTAGLREATIETDGDPGPELLAGYARAGFDRVSVGVKAFSPPLREVLGAGELKEPDPVAAARSAGFTSVSLDLVYGIWGRPAEEFAGDLERTIALDPDHVSLYALEGTVGGTPKEADPDLSAAMFRESRRILEAGGFRQYEITNFSRPGHRSLHNMVYWQDGDFVGLGPSAHSCLTRDGIRVRWRNLPDVAAWLGNPSGCRETLSREGGRGRAAEALILALRMTEGVDRALFVRRYGTDPLDLMRSRLAEFTELGLIRHGAGRVRLTTRGMLLSNEVFVHILEEGPDTEGRTQNTE